MFNLPPNVFPMVILALPSKTRTKKRFSDGKSNCRRKPASECRMKRQRQKRETASRIKYDRGQQRPHIPETPFGKKRIGIVLATCG